MPFSAFTRLLPKSPSAGSVVASDTSLSVLPESNIANADKFGLFRLYAKDGAIASVNEEADTFSDTADIIAIHGLGGSPYNTWTHKNGFLWLQHIATNEFPGTRVFTFGYDSGFAFSNGTGSLRDFSKSLLEAIKLERVTPESRPRPIILICHSMGGIVAKLAVNIARNEPDHYPGVGKAITAILFLGTPHQGSRSARYATILARVANVFLKGTQSSRFTGPMRTDLLKSLELHASELLAIAEDFRIHTSNIKIISFVEGKNLGGLNSRIVGDGSAFVGAAGERKVPMPSYNHREMCRFASQNENGYKLLLGALRESLSASTSEIPSNLSVVRNKVAPYLFVNIPFPPNSSFVGQQHVLEQMALALTDGSGTRQLALYGLGGIGKSQIALQYAHKVHDENHESSIFWVFAANKERFEQGYAAIAKGLRLPGHDDPEVDILNLVKNSLLQPHFGKWLMIIDNADDMTIFHGSPEGERSQTDNYTGYYSNGLMNFIPDCPSGSVIFTTRNKANALQLTSEGHILHVTEMSIEDLMVMLENKLHTVVVDKEVGAESIKTLELLPLAIVQAASFIRQNSWTISKYLKYFKSKDKELHAEFLSHEFQDKTRDRTVSNAVFKTWMIIARELENQHPVAAETLWLMSFYNRQNIPRSLLLKSKRLRIQSPAHSYDMESGSSRVDPVAEADFKLEQDSFQLDKAIGTLVAYSLVDFNQQNESESYTMHRLVQVFARYWIRKHNKDGQNWCNRALLTIAEQFPKLESYVWMNWSQAAELLPHVQEIVDVRNDLDGALSELGILLTASCNFLTAKGDYTLAAQYVSIAMEALQQSLGGENSSLLNAQWVVARIQRDTGRLQEAEGLYRYIIDAYPKFLGENHPQTFKAMRGLSVLFCKQGRYLEAESMARKSLQGLQDLRQAEQNQGDEDDQEIIDGKSALATILGSTRRLQEALAIQKAGYQYYHGKYGPKDPRTMESMHDLAVTLYKNCEYEHSRTLSERLFNLCIDFYGQNHPRIRSVAWHLGLVYLGQKKYQRAEAIFEHIAKGRLASHQRTHSKTIDCVRYLESCLQEQRKFEEAAFYDQIALELVIEQGNLVQGATVIKDSISWRWKRIAEVNYQDSLMQQQQQSPITTNVEVGIVHLHVPRNDSVYYGYSSDEKDEDAGMGL